VCIFLKKNNHTTIIKMQSLKSKQFAIAMFNKFSAYSMQKDKEIPFYKLMTQIDTKIDRDVFFETQLKQFKNHMKENEINFLELIKFFESYISNNESAIKISKIETQYNWEFSVCYKSVFNYDLFIYASTIQSNNEEDYCGIIGSHGYTYNRNNKNITSITTPMDDQLKNLVCEEINEKISNGTLQNLKYSVKKIQQFMDVKTLNHGTMMDEIHVMIFSMKKYGIFFVIDMSEEHGISTTIVDHYGSLVDPLNINISTTPLSKNTSHLWVFDFGKDVHVKLGQLQTSPTIIIRTNFFH
jgi:hypothetical protein